MRRSDLQTLARGKLDDAQLLLVNFRPGNAYYLAGYCVELGLKACVSRQIAKETIPDKSILTGVLSHNFDQLVGLAGLKGELESAKRDHPDFAANWAIVLRWSPDSRYRASLQIDAEYLVQAASDPANGVLPWIRRYW